MPCWNDLVYIPLIDANSIFKAKYNNGKDDINQASIYAAYAAWRQYKEIYSFSAELSEILFEQAEEDIIIPTETLYKIPYNSIYINVSDNEGFFVFFEQNVFTCQMELRFCCVEEHGGDTSITNVWVNLDEGNTVSDGIAKGLDGLKKYIGNVRYKIKIDGEYVLQTEQQMFTETFRIVSRYIQLSYFHWFSFRDRMTLRRLRLHSLPSRSRLYISYRLLLFSSQELLQQLLICPEVELFLFSVSALLCRYGLRSNLSYFRSDTFAH